MIDTVIFDIDGVLIDVTRSFRLVIAMVVADYLKTYENYYGPSLITPEGTQIFKDRGGFNNDWELTEAAILIVYHLRNEYQHFTPITDLPAWYQGGGLEEIYQKTGISRLDSNWIIRRFQTFYAGRKYCKRLYGFEPETEFLGLIDSEQIILRKEELKEGFNYAIATGRTESETLLAIEKMGLEPGFFKGGIVWGLKKPDPQEIQRLEFQHGVYIGDTIDDLNMVKSFKSEERKLSFIMIKPPFRKDIDLEIPEALFVAEDVNGALRALYQNRGEWT